MDFSETVDVFSLGLGEHFYVALVCETTNRLASISLEVVVKNDSGGNTGDGFSMETSVTMKSQE